MPKRRINMAYITAVKDIDNTKAFMSPIGPMTRINIMRHKVLVMPNPKYSKAIAYMTKHSIITPSLGILSQLILYSSLDPTSLIMMTMDKTAITNPSAKGIKPGPGRAIRTSPSSIDK